MTFIDIKTLNKTKEKIAIILDNITFLYKQILALKTHSSDITTFSEASKWFCALLEFKRRALPTDISSLKNTLNYLDKNELNTAQLEWKAKSALLELEIINMEIMQQTSKWADNETADEQEVNRKQNNNLRAGDTEDIVFLSSNYVKACVVLLLLILRINKKKKRVIIDELESKYSIQFGISI